MSKYSQEIRDICADYIRTKIREISESRYATAWYIGIEFMVWDATQSPSTLLDEREAQLLRAASEACGGWVAWDNHVGDDVFVPISEWNRMCSNNEQGGE